MVDEIGEEEFYSIEEGERCFDLDYEFDAPRCFDFNHLETDCEAKEAELWFESAGSYPPSRKPFHVFLFFFNQFIMLSKVFYCKVF